MKKIKKKKELICISLEGIRIHGKHGIYDSEKKEGNDFEIDVRVFMKHPEKGFRDEIAYTVDYEKIYETVVRSFEGSINLIETLCENTGLALLNVLPLVKKAIVKVSKLNPPVGGEVERGSVEMVFER